MHEKYRLLIYSTAARDVADPEAAEDIAQETFIRAYRKISELREPAKFLAWLHGIRRYVTLEYFRTRERQEKTERKASDDGQRCEHELELDAVWNEIKDIFPEGEIRRIAYLYLVKIAERNIAKIANALGRPRREVARIVEDIEVRLCRAYEVDPHRQRALRKRYSARKKKRQAKKNECKKEEGNGCLSDNLIGPDCDSEG